MFKTLAIVMLSTLAFSGGASGCQRNSSAVQMPSAPKSPTDMKVLAEGLHSNVTRPLVAVIRDSGTYFALAQLAGNLPKLDEEFFKSKLIVAAFLGERNTGGYSVEIRREVVGQFGMSKEERLLLRIVEQAPGKGAMVPQVITSPFKLVSIELAASDSVMLAPDHVWQQSSRHFVITKGTFTMAGGIAGRVEEFALDGNLYIAREGSFVNVMFLAFSAKSEKRRHLTDFATAVVNGDGRFQIRRMSAGSLIDAPNSGLRVAGTLAGDKVSLTLTSLPTMISDGYSGVGIIEAVMQSPSKP